MPGLSAGTVADCPRTPENTEQRRRENRLFTSIFRFAAKSLPIATKLGEHDYKAVGELPLRAHHPI
jgi:hypothetical protein